MTTETNDLTELRKRAEAKLERQARDVREMPPGDVAKVVYELRTHQIELEMQNEELRRAQQELIESRDRLSDLYDFSPVGYLTVGRNGLILEGNLTIAEMLSTERHFLIDQPLSRFILNEDEDVFYLHRQELIATREPRTCEIRMRRGDADVFWAEMKCVLVDDNDGGGSFRASISDITPRRQAEEKIGALAAFPAENPDPVLRTTKDAVLIFANPPGQALLKSWGCAIGQRLPKQLSDTVFRAFTTGERQNLETMCEGRTFEMRIAPIAEAAYVNLYGVDISERKRAERALRISHRVLEIVNRHSEMKPLLQEFVAEAQDFSGCAAVGIRILSDDGSIPYQAYHGFSREFYELESPLSQEAVQCMCVNIIRGELDPKLPCHTEGGSFHVNGTTKFLATIPEEARGPSRNTCNRFGYESVGLIPIRQGNRILGLVHLADPREDAIPLEVIETLEKVAMQLGEAIQRVRAEESLQEAHDGLERRVEERTAQLILLNAKLLRQIEDRKQLEDDLSQISAFEQQRIGQDLHDGLAQELLGAGLLAKGLEKSLTDRELPDADVAGQLVEAIQGAQKNVRALIEGVRPVEVEARGLTAALSELADSVESLADIRCDFECDWPVTKEDDHVAAQLFRIVQEAVRNAVKHSEAQRIVIGLKVEREQLTVSVRDNGKGVQRDPRETKGMGLRIMQYRAEIIGANLSIGPADGGGTLVVCTLPQDDNDPK